MTYIDQRIRWYLAQKEDVAYDEDVAVYDRHDAQLVAQAFQNLPCLAKWSYENWEEIDNTDIKEQ